MSEQQHPTTRQLVAQIAEARDRVSSSSGDGGAVAGLGRDDVEA